MSEWERLRAQVVAVTHERMADWRRRALDVEACLGCTLRGCDCGQDRKSVYAAEIRAALAVGGDESPGDTLNEPTPTDRRVYFDTEFIEDGRTIDLLSIGLVRADGTTYYAEPKETDRTRASDWVAENVLPHLTGPVKPRAQIAREIVEFAGSAPEFWAWYADYDWVALCQLFGTMMDLPTGWPMFCRDFRQVTSGDLLPEQDAQDGPEHHALSDARWLARVARAATAE